MTSREAILRFARAELQRVGIADLSLRRVAKSAGLTPMAIYWHFKDRADLLAAVASQSFAVWQKRGERIKARDPVAWLRRLARAYLDFSLDEPEHFDACFVFRVSNRSRQISDFRADRSGVVALMVDKISSAQSRGQLAAGESLDLAFALWAQMHGLAMLHRSDGITMSRQELLSLGSRCVDFLLRSPAASERRA